MVNLQAWSLTQTTLLRHAPGSWTVNTAKQGGQTLVLSMKILRQGWVALLLVCSHNTTAHPDAAHQIQKALHATPLEAATAVPAHQLTTGDLATFYALRDYQPAWLSDQQLVQLQTTIDDLHHDGLRTSDYALPPHAAPFKLCREMAITQAYLQALLHLHFGRLDRETIEPLWRHREPNRVQDRLTLLALAAAGADNPAEAFERARPPFPVYDALRQAYIELLEQKDQLPWPTVSPGSLLRPGTLDSRVEELRLRLAIGGYDTGVSENTQLYDQALQRAVVAFQHDHYLAEDALVGTATLNALNKPREAVLDQLLANLERLRWRHADMERDLLLVDIAGAKARYYQADNNFLNDTTAPVWEARVQVGTRHRQTPALKSVITHFTLNPSWTVPPTILRQDKIPEIRRNPSYLTKNHMQVLNSEGQPLDPGKIDWARPGAIMLRQSPGPHNALGRVAIRFPNPFSVYLHDTPNQQLFDTAQRTYSSGCVRVEHAMTLVDRLIAHASDYSPAYISRVLDGGRTGNIRLDRPIPVLMDYWTADIDHSHRVVLRPDIYRQDPPLAAAMRRLPPSEPPWSCPLS